MTNIIKIRRNKMCYNGCNFENKEGGCKKPFNKICPAEIDIDPENSEIRQDRLDYLQKKLKGEKEK